MPDLDPGTVAGHIIAAALALVVAGVILAAGWRLVAWVLP